VLPLEGHAVPIPHGLPARLGPDTTRADDRWDTDTGPADPAPDDEQTWPFYPMEQIDWLSRRLAWPAVPATVLDPSAPLPDPAPERAEGGLSVPNVVAVIGPKTAPTDLVDRVWAFVINAARAHRGSWNLYALGLARQGLHRHAEKITYKRPPTIKANVQHVMAAEMLIELHRTEPDETGCEAYAFDIAKPYIYARLRDHCLYMVTTRRWTRLDRDRRNLDLARFELLHEALSDGNARSRLHHEPGRADAYSVLARLVAQTAGERRGRQVRQSDAALIALTHLVGYSLADAAVLLGLTEPAARMRQHRAVKVVAAILAREHAEDIAAQRN
jgi:DNA-directed RNA polymerase specialized sigma24 family protein